MRKSASSKPVQPEGLKPVPGTGDMSENVVVLDDHVAGRPCITVHIFTDVVVGEAGEKFTLKERDADGKVVSTRTIERKNPLIGRIRGLFRSPSALFEADGFEHGARITLSVNENVPREPGKQAGTERPAWTSAVRKR